MCQCKFFNKQKRNILYAFAKTRQKKKQQQDTPLDNMDLKNPFRALNRDLIIKKAFYSQDKGKKTCAYPKVENGRQRPKTH